MNVMTLHDLNALFEEYEVYSLAFGGTCAACSGPIAITIDITADGFKIDGGGVFKNPAWDGKDESKRFRCKCDACMAVNPVLEQEAEVYSRVVGYMRPVRQWNDGKRMEFEKRKTFDRTVKP